MNTEPGTRYFKDEINVKYKFTEPGKKNLKDAQEAINRFNQVFNYELDSNDLNNLINKNKHLHPSYPIPCQLLAIYESTMGIDRTGGFELKEVDQYNIQELIEDDQLSMETGDELFDLLLTSIGIDHNQRDRSKTAHIIYELMVNLYNDSNFADNFIEQINHRTGQGYTYGTLNPTIIYDVTKQFQELLGIHMGSN